MKLIDKLKQLYNENNVKNIEREAKLRYSIVEFDNSLYIAFDGIPICGFSDYKCTIDVLKELHAFQQRYIDYKNHNTTSKEKTTF